MILASREKYRSNSVTNYQLQNVASNAKYDINTGEVKNLNLEISPKNASEQRFHWSYSVPGIVHISDTIFTDPNDVSVPKRTIHTMRGIKAGKVTVTGTPYDQTSGATALEFEVVVTEAENQDHIEDLDGILSWAQNKMNGISDSYAAQAKLADYWKIAENGKLEKDIAASDLDYIQKSLFANGKLTQDAMTIAKSILALRAAGIDPERYYGYNLVNELSQKAMPKDNIYSLSTYLWALSSDNYGAPYVQENKEEAVRAILSMQNLGEGLWLDQYGWQDPTGFALYALAPYYNDVEVKQAVEHAVNALSLKQQADGDVSDNSNSLAMIAGGLWSCDPEYLTDKRLVKNGKTLLHALKKYEVPGKNEFVWKTDAEGSKFLATEQVFRSLVSYFAGNVFDYRNTAKQGIYKELPNQSNNGPSVTPGGTGGTGGGGGGGSTPPATKIAENKVPLASPEEDTIAVFVINSKKYQMREDGKMVSKTLDIAPTINRSRTMLPVRLTGEVLGIKADYDNKTKTAKFTFVGEDKKVNVIEMTIGKKMMKVNGFETPLTADIMVINGRMVLPISDVQRAVKALGQNIDILWNNETKEVTLKRSGK